MAGNRHAYVGLYKEPQEFQHSPKFASSAMGAQPENTHWMAVPQFGGWDQKAPGATDYSMVFSRARANRKQHKSDLTRSLGNEKELLAATPYHHQPEDPVVKKKRILTYINCCIRP
ncbi:uncharacterized protein LOC116210869 isoform X2 [Punica granatum]|uniref:RIN4 pathogenic type III effector avirulence factor Avr cleavage site domain-containing protein n=2 Tax=Punica granatum TaxID=22663 RepID=A0A218W9A8_PUNGR|nr:uncharacterized protein LOC116210869 isoform X2 [Punica granatum]OWM69133.1 hypothetical protein CDL15_Pgr025320 [Punica granatum]PKI57777.1 hypothetical protein CRG98_021844 [Punica granatum]